jgi:hypothetical protein
MRKDDEIRLRQMNIIDPDGSGPFFETPIVGSLPEELNFIP